MSGNGYVKLQSILNGIDFRRKMKQRIEKVWTIGKLVEDYTCFSIGEVIFSKKINAITEDILGDTDVITLWSGEDKVLQFPMTSILQILYGERK